MNSCQYKSRRAFTLVELLVVISVVMTLAGIVLGVRKNASAKAMRVRAQSEIAAFCSAAESYKADNAVYPSSSVTNTQDPFSATTSGYAAANLVLYTALSGDGDLNGTPDVTEGRSGASTSYIELKSSQLSFSGGKVAYIRDPWDSSSQARPYGYSTRRAAAVSSGGDDASAGRNMTFDLWSTAGQPETPAAWIGNW